MANLFKPSYLPYVLVAVGLVLIFVWARTRGSVEGFDNAVPAPAGSNPWKFNMYYVDWCPHCHHAKPEFEGLGPTMTIGDKSVVLQAIEAEKNPEAIRGLKISGYPTFLLYDAEGKIVADYDGPRKGVSFRSFLEDSVNMKAEQNSH
jgi:hypothetical protein